jgi:DNA-binding NtrC family response regulator
MCQSQILLVDDDQALLGALSEFLQGEGYLVQPAISGDVALVLLQQRVPFRLLITDIVLPGLVDGFALARRAREFCPGIPIIYTTGYLPVAHVRSPGAPFGEMLVKPYRIETLLTAVSSALGERRECEWYMNSSRGSDGFRSTPLTRRDSSTLAPRKSDGSAAANAANIKSGKCPDFRLKV